MVDIATVAQHAGVSTATVSRALNGKSASDKTRRKVLAAVEELGYVMSSSASSLARGRTRTIGYTAPYLGRWYFSEILQGIETALITAGYDLLVYSPQDAANQRDITLPTSLRKNVIDGLIVASIDIATDNIHTLQTLGKPIVTIGSTLTGATEISIDDIGMAQMATEHLISLGHTRIGHLGADTTPDATFRLSERRYQGWATALTNAGLTADPTLYRHTDFDMQSGYHGAKQLLGHHRPTAIFADSDEIAIGALLAARDLGIRVPDELSIIGIDNHNTAEFFGLTTIAQHPTAQGNLAATLILNALENDEPLIPRTAEFELIVRSSTTGVPGTPAH
ncbi:transcriptional regulator, LacI family [Microbacterium hydrothermale]|uniref:LacI family DNA-binding transcriptional regulator n=1 Tax=Microbacterium hydrothermale TaxID=857427 RepID=UPI0022279DD3|nr:LacI family DNA-binding transcriptional regulator [Microbacterium hydrothermale]MCW2166348.1 transcriptional regulator, LacI family [Microbacterium hydrothermale]